MLSNQPQLTYVRVVYNIYGAIVRWAVYEYNLFAHALHKASSDWSPVHKLVQLYLNTNKDIYQKPRQLG